jgi:hypothetical protein
MNTEDTNITNQSSSPANSAGWTLRQKRAAPLISNVGQQESGQISTTVPGRKYGTKN